MNRPLTIGHNRILPAGEEDLARILPMYEAAIRFQRTNNYIGWQRIDERFIIQDAREGLLHKVCLGEAIAAVFCICLADPLIWQERERGDALYLHRVVVGDGFRGGRWFEKILAWAEETARQLDRRFIRMDTWADNAKLIGYYETYGFARIDVFTTGDDPALPEQHRNLRVALLERTIGSK